MVKYLGSKRVLLDLILEAVFAFPEVKSVFDVFSGTSRVGHALKSKGYQVFSNDHNAHAHCLATTYVQADLEEIRPIVCPLLDELNELPGSPGFITHHYCEHAQFFHPDNGARIDAIRSRIAELGVNEEVFAVLLTSLLEAADRVDSTTGLQMAYLKQYAARASQPLRLRMPALLPRAIHGKGHAYGLDVFEAVETVSADLAYLDPPYNQHSYLANYHIWETLVRWDEPEVYGKARKRVDVRSRKSPFNSRADFLDAFSRLIDRVQAPILLVSFNNEGFLSGADAVRILSRRGEVAVLIRDHPRYVGAKIGIYNPYGLKVGRISHVKNKEYLFVVADPLPASLALHRPELLQAL